MDYQFIFRILYIAGVLIVIVLFVSFFWITRLHKEIRQRKQIQLDLEKAKREADEANEFKSSFLARMSHEIRTPLNAITGMSYLLKKTEPSLTQNTYIDRIAQAANNMLSIINDILDFSKIEAGKVEFEIASFSMDQVIRDVVSIVSYKIDEQKIGFRLTKDPLVPNWFFGDPKRIEQILLNVLNNAAKFTSSGEVSFDIRLVAKENDKYHISFTIKDTGIGMSEEQVNKLFTPFEQGDSSINRRFGGSGLGLSIVKNLLDMMGGEIKVSSTLGEGSTFVIHLSLDVDKEKEAGDVRTLVLEEVAENSGPSPNSEPDLTKADRQSCVLLAEDNKTNQLIAKSLLEQVGIESIIASNGKEAVELYHLHRDRIDLILMDLHMPVMNGYEAAEKIRELSDSVPIVAMTADVIPGVRDKCEQSGIFHYISKPFNPDHFIKTIKDIMLKNEYNIDRDVRVLDQQLGMKNMGNNLELYHQVLEEYLKENQDTLDKLEAAVREKRYADAAQIVHKVKSSSGSIGAKSLQSAATTLQEALNQDRKEEITSLQDRFSKLLGKLLEEINLVMGYQE